VADVVLAQRLRTRGLSILLAVVALGVTGAVIAAATVRGVFTIALLGPVLITTFLVLSVKVEVRVLGDDTGRSLEVTYGGGLVRQRFGAADIIAARAVSLSWWQLGGWGYRGSLKLMRYAALATRRGAALELTLGGGRRFVVTVDEPERFVAALQP
jgi:hypothetical protein